MVNDALSGLAPLASALFWLHTQNRVQYPFRRVYLMSEIIPFRFSRITIMHSNEIGVVCYVISALECSPNTSGESVTGRLFM